MASNKTHRRQPSQKKIQDRIKNRDVLREVFCDWLFPQDTIFADWQMHGNIKWKPEQLVSQAILFSWQGDKHLVDAFEYSYKVCGDIGLIKVARSYTSMMNALIGYGEQLRVPVRNQLHELAQSISGRHFRVGKFVPIAFDGSRLTTPRTVSNEEAFCAPNHGKGKTATYRKKQTKGMRRTKNEKNKPHQPKPQVWLTMMWHMGLKLPWTWTTGPSNASERAHVQEMVEEENFPENTLFCGDAGFIGYPIWSAIIGNGSDFLVRVGANAHLLSANADYQKKAGGIVWCWPKGQMDSGIPPLRLRLVKVAIGKTKVWLLTSVLDPQELSVKRMVKLYKMRWGVEVEFRGLKQTIDKHTLSCRTPERALVELDWSLFALAFAELLSLREQIPEHKDGPLRVSLAETMRAIRRAMRERNERVSREESVVALLKVAAIKGYKNRTDKKSRYRPKNPDKKPLGDPSVRRLDAKEHKKLKESELVNAA